MLAIVGCGAAIAVLASGISQPPADFTIPWAVIPVPGFLIAFWAAERYRARFRDRAGWRGTLGTFLDAAHLVRELFVHPGRWASALLGMTLFWAGEAFAAWAGLAAFGFHMNAAALIVGYGTGMVFTRRTGPLGGAGVLALVLPLTLWYSGAPLAVAVAGVFAYQALSFWLPMPVSLACLPTLRTTCEPQITRATAITGAPKVPGLARLDRRRWWSSPGPPGLRAAFPDLRYPPAAPPLIPRTTPSLNSLTSSSSQAIS